MASSKKVTLSLMEGALMPSRRRILEHFIMKLKVEMDKLIIGTKFVIVICASSEEAIKCATIEAKEIIEEIGLTPIISQENVTSRSLICRSVDEWIMEHSIEEIQEEMIKTSNVCPEEIIKFPTNNRMLKIVFSSTQDADSICRSGLRLFSLKIPAARIEKDKFIFVRMCYKCYALNTHTTIECRYNGKICSECSSKTHIWKDCKSGIKKCVNCQGNHNTLSKGCPSRKTAVLQVRKEKATKIQEKKGLRTKNANIPGNAFSYANALKRVQTNIEASIKKMETKLSVIPAVSHPQSQRERNSRKRGSQTQNDNTDKTTVLLGCMIHAHLCNLGSGEGSYGQVLNDTLKANGLPRIEVPYIPKLEKGHKGTSRATKPGGGGISSTGCWTDANHRTLSVYGKFDTKKKEN